ncbi:MAG: alpha/beta hydrolase [Roseiarcus sp.]|jgi:predicted alpha/beta hydrolase family esterase
MRTADLDLLFLAGLGGSGPDHLQSRWRPRLTTARLVDEADWDRPDAAGHVNVACGHGPWPEGLLQLAGFLRTL